MEDNSTEHQKILLEIVDGIDAYIKEHEHRQVCDPCKGVYIPSNIVKRLIEVRLPRLADDNNNPVPNSKELILLAQTDWHNREERKHRYEMIPWTMGWITGFLSERKPYWPKVHEAAIRKDERKIIFGKTNWNEIEKGEGFFAKIFRVVIFSCDDEGNLDSDVLIDKLKKFEETLCHTSPIQEHDSR